MTDCYSDAPNAPKVIGPYSQAVVANGFAFLSGQVPVDPATGKLVEGDIGAQCEQVMKNLQAVLRHLGLDFSHVVKSTIYLLDLKNYQTVNGIYERWLENIKPARATVEVAGLPANAMVEIEMIAVMDKR